MPDQKPAIIFVFSGKRKSGKDYVTEILHKSIGSDKCSILRLSEPLKAQYAKDHNLDLNMLLGSSEYKERYRGDMILWGEEQRMRDPGFFCRIITCGPGADKLVWIISDARRRTDVNYFKEAFCKCVVTVRVTASEEIRRERGWVVTPGVDDAESECGLDTGVDFDVVVPNDGNAQQLEAALQQLISMATKSLATS